MSMTLTVNTSRYGSGFASAVQYGTTTIINETVKLKIPPQKGECALFLDDAKIQSGSQHVAGRSTSENNCAK
jgi:hypothetical protein